MKIKNKIFLAFFLCILTNSSCLMYGYQQETIVNNPSDSKPFKNPLIVIPFDERAPKSIAFADFVKLGIENDLNALGKKAEVITVQSFNAELSLYDDDEVNIYIQNLIKEKNFDVLITLNKTGRMVHNFKHIYCDGYEIVATDQKDQKECWIGRLKTGNNSSPSEKNIAGNIVSALMMDDII